jgi:hypothetical protein
VHASGDRGHDDSAVGTAVDVLGYPLRRVLRQPAVDEVADLFVIETAIH